MIGNEMQVPKKESKGGGYNTLTHNHVAVSLVSGACAGAVAKTTIAPLDRTKIYFQVTKKRYRLRKAFKFIHNTYSSDGLLSLWRGNSATMARVIPFAAIQFTAHDQYKILLNPPGSKEKVLPPVRRFVAGSLAGGTATLFTYPFDMVRARMAVSRKQLYKGLLDTFKVIVKDEGLLTLYRGITPTMLGIIPYAGCSFYTYESLKKLYRDKHNVDPSPVVRVAAGALAGLVGQTGSYPLDIVRRRMQTDTVFGIRYTSIIGTFVTIFKTEGLRGLYKGATMNWIKGPISVTVSFNVYETLKKWLNYREQT